jgi:hypothetical protein
MIKEKKKKEEAEEEEEEFLAEWAEDDPVGFPDDENSEVVKPKIGEKIKGRLVEKLASKRWPGRIIYKIQDPDDNKIKVMLGTTILDRLMSVKDVGDDIIIERLSDIPTEKGNPLQNWKTYSKKKKQ